MIAVIIFIISCVTIYHNTNSFEPKQRIIYIILGMVVMYFITTIICNIKSSGIKIDNKEAINQTLKVVKMIFTPINGMIILASLRQFIWKSKRSRYRHKASK